MSHFRSIFRLINPGDSYQVSRYGPENNRAFLPSDIAGLTGWWDASDSNYITGTGTGNVVKTWSNKGSAGGNISGSLGALMTTVQSYKNGRQAIYFSTSSASSYWETSINGNALDGATTKTWFIAYQANPVMPPASALAAHDLPSIVIDRFVGVVLSEGTKNPGTDVARWYFDGNDPGFTDFLSSSVSPSSGSNFIINTVAQIDTTSPYAQQLTMSINGGTDDTRISTSFMRASVTTPYGIGSPPASGQRGTPRNRYWYEILFYTGTLTSAERTRIVKYLNDKWAIY